ncbi:MAG: hypothetical protein ABSF53_26280 [Terracidiphilus sp.]
MKLVKNSLRRFALLLTAVVMVSACGHPLIPASALRPIKKSGPVRSSGPVLGVDLYALSNYPAAEVKADGQRTLAYIKNVLKADAVGIVWDFYAASRHSDAVEETANTLSARNVGILTRIAIRDHLLVQYRPLIFVSSEPENPWEGMIRPENPARWFSNYYMAELPYLRRAQRLGVEEFVTATEMDDLNNSPRASPGGEVRGHGHVQQAASPS